MKKKPILMIASTLIALLVLTPIVQAGVTHYWWDNVYFKEGDDIDYAHPDDDYYGVSPSIDWTILGYDLDHHQINRATTYGLVVGAVIICEVLQLLLFRRLGMSPTALIVGNFAGIVLSSFIGVILDYYFVDERGCMWLWIGSVFMGYLLENLLYLSGLHKELALSTILSAFICFGYFRVGKIIFNDPLGLGHPSPPPTKSLTISIPYGHGRTNPLPEGTHTLLEGSLVILYACADEHYVFTFWQLDGQLINDNPIRFRMDSDHTLIGYFRQDADGGGGVPGYPVDRIPLFF